MSTAVLLADRKQRMLPWMVLAPRRSLRQGEAVYPPLLPLSPVLLHAVVFSVTGTAGIVYYVVQLLLLSILGVQVVERRSIWYPLPYYCCCLEVLRSTLAILKVFVRRSIAIGGGPLYGHSVILLRED